MHALFLHPNLSLLPLFFFSAARATARYGYQIKKNASVQSRMPINTKYLFARHMSSSFKVFSLKKENSYMNKRKRTGLVLNFVFQLSGVNKGICFYFMITIFKRPLWQGFGSVRVTRLPGYASISASFMRSYSRMTENDNLSCLCFRLLITESCTSQSILI